MRLRTLLASFTVATLLLSIAPARAAEIEILTSFDAGAGELPEGVAVDKRGNVYVSLITPVSAIRKIAPDGTQTTLVDLGFQTGNGPLGLAVNARGTVFAATATFDPATQGVYAIAPDGSAERLPGTGQIGFPNGLTFDHEGNLYVTDSSFGAVWRIPRRGSAELWIQDPLLEGTGELGAGVPIGANGITFRAPDEILVGNTERGTLVSIPTLPDGAAGEPTVIADDAAIFGVDGLTVDVHGAIYAAVIAQSTIVRVDGDTIETLATEDHGLNQASSIAFGQGIRDRMSLFGVNFGIFSPEPTPSLFRLPVGVPGAPAP